MLACFIKVGIYHTLMCWVQLFESYTEIWKGGVEALGRAARDLGVISGYSLLLYLVNC